MWAPTFMQQSCCDVFGWKLTLRIPIYGWCIANCGYSQLRHTLLTFICNIYQPHQHNRLLNKYQTKIICSARKLLSIVPPQMHFTSMCFTCSMCKLCNNCFYVMLCVHSLSFHSLHYAFYLPYYTIMMVSIAPLCASAASYIYIFQ